MEITLTIFRFISNKFFYLRFPKLIQFVTKE